MVFKKNRNTEFVTYSGKTNKELKVEKLIERKNNAKSFKGWLEGCKRVALNDYNLELAELFEEIISKYKEFHVKEVVELEIVDGWKGSDQLEVYRGFTNDFVIKTHNKDKETGKVTTTIHTIPRENVNKLVWWIKSWEVGESHKCYEFAEKLGFGEWKNLWRERKLYFQLYYFPIKILEKIGVVRYSGRGLVTKIK